MSNNNSAEEIAKRNLIWKIESVYSRTKKSIYPPALLDLINIGVCSRCCLRFFNIREIGIYQEPTSNLNHLMNYILNITDFENQQQPVVVSLSENTTSTVESTTETTTTSTTTTTATTTSETKTNEIVKPKFQYDIESVKNLTNLNNACITCFGMLQDTNEGELFLDKFLEKISQSGYEFIDYSLALWLPYSTIIREYSVWYYLKQHHTSEKITFFKKDTPEDDVVEIKEGVKWILGPIIGKKFNYKFKPASDFRMNMNYNHQESKDEHLFLFDIKVPDRKRLKQQRKSNRSATDSNFQILDILEKISMKDFMMNGTCPPTKPTTKFDYTLTFEHAPIFIAGRYNKYARNLSQTPWTPDRKVTEAVIDSVDTFISTPIKELCKADATNFVASGREDIDVRMLGAGRPFFLEITNPHKILLKYKDFRDIEEKINQNQDIKVSRLQIITKKQTSILKEGETSKQKIYRCVVWTAKEFTDEELHKLLDSVSNLQLKQNTPVRVMHRRSLMERKKTISKLAFQIISPHFMILDVWASAGTYIKEFVHGDLGRTTPNLGSLLNSEADILQLDVLDIDLDFPTIPKP